MRYLVPVVLLAACAPPDTSGLFQQLHVETTDAAGVTAKFVESIDSASDTIDIALPSIQDMDIANALIEAQDRGVAVRVVTDIDQEADGGVVAVKEAQIPVQLADGAVVYYDFSTNVDIGWPSEEVIFSHSFAILDGIRFVQANEAGTAAVGARVVFDGQMEILGEDLGREFQQVFGGTDATALDSYDEQSKSITDARWRYANQTGLDLEVWFGPQERLIKRVIDAAYMARSDIRIVTDDFADEGLAKALQEKARDGFSVEVVYGPRFKDSASTKSRVLERETPDVAKFAIPAPTDGSATPRIPTIVLYDYENDRGMSTRAFVLTHDLYSATRTDRGQPVITDQLIDGSLWVLNDYDGDPSGAMDDLEALYLSLRDMGVAQ